MNDFPPQADLMFTNPDGSMLRRSNFARRVWRPAVRRCELNEGLTFHGLRHTAVSIAVAHGAQLSEIAETMGWARTTEAQMHARYSHLLKHRASEIVESVELAYRRARLDTASRERADVLPFIALG